MITDNLPAFVAYVDVNGYYRFANKFYEDWFGRPTDELIGSHIEDVIGWATLRLFWNRSTKCCAANKSLASATFDRMKGETGISLQIMCQITGRTARFVATTFCLRTLRR